MSTPQRVFRNTDSRLSVFSIALTNVEHDVIAAENTLNVPFEIPNLLANLRVGDCAVGPKSLESTRTDVKFLHHNLTINPIFKEGTFALPTPGSGT